MSETCTFCKETYEPGIEDGCGLYMNEPVCASCGTMFLAAQDRIMVGAGPGELDWRVDPTRAEKEQEVIMRSPFSLPQAEAILYGGSRILQGENLRDTEPRPDVVLRRRAREILGVE